MKNINALPSELISHILYLGVPIFETDWFSANNCTVFAIRSYLLRILLVCRLWKDTALSTPSLWIFCYWGSLDWQRDGLDIHQSLRSHLERSKSLPIWVVLDCLDEFDEESRQVAIDAIATLRGILPMHRHRIHALVSKWPSPLTLPLGGPLDALRILWITRGSTSSAEIDPVAGLQTLAIRDHQYLGSGRDYLRGLQTKTIQNIHLVGGYYATYHDLIKNCPGLESLSFRSCVFEHAPEDPIRIQRVQFIGTVMTFLPFAKIYFTSVEHLDITLEKDSMSRYDYSFPTLYALVSLRFKFFGKTSLSLGVLSDMLAHSPALRYLEVNAHEIATPQADLYTELTSQLGGDEDSPPESPPSSSSNAEEHEVKLRAPSLQFLRVGAIQDGERSLGAGGSLRSLLLVRPLLRIQFVFIRNCSIYTLNEHLEVHKEFPDQIEVREDTRIYDGFSLPKLVDIATNNVSHGLGNSTRYANSLTVNSRCHSTNSTVNTL